MMNNYIDLIRELLWLADHGDARPDRTQTGTFSRFGVTLEFDLRHGFPLLTQRQLTPLSVFAETTWFLHGRTDLKYLQDYNCKFWDKFAGPTSGDIGPMYGKLWRSYGEEGFDQIANIIHLLRNDPFSRRMMVISDDPSNNPHPSLSPSENADLGRQSLGACHPLFQCRTEVVNGVKYLDLLFYMRSSDAFLGLPVNIASYATIAHILAKVSGHVPRRLIYMGGDVHLYKNHVEQARILVERAPMPLPKLDLSNSAIEFDDMTLDWKCLTPGALVAGLTNYRHWPHLSAKIAV